MAKVLRGGAYGPDGDYVGPGEKPASGWPKWFLNDLEEHGHLVDGPDDGAAGDREPRQPKPAGGDDAVALTGASSRGRKARS